MFSVLTEHPHADPLEQLRHEQRTLDQARRDTALQEGDGRRAAEKHGLQQALDSGAITPEAYVRALSEQDSQQPSPPRSLQERLDDHRILARLEHDLALGRVDHILDAAGSERTPGTDDTVLRHLEAIWHDGNGSRPPAHGSPPWTGRPYGHVPTTTLVRHVPWLRSSIPSLLEQAQRAEDQADVLTTDAEHGLGPAATVLRQQTQSSRAAAMAAQAASTSFERAATHTRRARMLHRAADEADRRARTNPVQLILQATTPAAQRVQARRLRAQAELARSDASAALTEATELLNRARALRTPADRGPRQTGPTGEAVAAAIRRDIHDAANPARGLRDAAVHLREKAARYQEHLDQLTAEENIRTTQDPRQYQVEEREREIQHRAETSAPARSRPPTGQQRQPGRQPNPPTAGPAPS
ncbi:hypothetical protein ACWC5I_05080 [Kitasatospora sp. NPDC001574]